MKQCIMGLLCLAFSLAAVTLAAAYTFTRTGEGLAILLTALALFTGWQAMKGTENGN